MRKPRLFGKKENNEQKTEQKADQSREQKPSRHGGHAHGGQQKQNSHNRQRHREKTSGGIDGGANSGGKMGLAQLADGRLDAALLALPVHDDRLHAEFLFEEPFVLAVPEDNPLAERSSLTMDELHDLQLLLLEDGHCLRDQALDVCHLAGASEKSEFRATSLETLRQMVAAGVGVTLLPALAVKPPVAPFQATS